MNQNMDIMPVTPALFSRIEWFCYSMPKTTVTAGSTVTLTVQNDGMADFVANRIFANYDTTKSFTVNIQNTTNGKNLFNPTGAPPENFACLPGRTPQYLACPIFLSKVGAFQLTITNNEGTDEDIQITFEGYKGYNTNADFLKQMGLWGA